MPLTIKAFHQEDCRRFSVDKNQVQFGELKKKIQNTFQLETDFVLKYKDNEGDLCTITAAEELDDLIDTDQIKERGTLRLQVVPANQAHQGILNSSMFFGGGAGNNTPTTTGPIRSNSTDPSFLDRAMSPGPSPNGSGGPRSKFFNEFSDAGMLEILRDISLLICARENALAELPPGASSWVSASKNLITPHSAETLQRLSYTRAVRPKLNNVFPGSTPTTGSNNNKSDIFAGVTPSTTVDQQQQDPSRVDLWTTENVGQWLSARGYQDCVQDFQEQDITGDILLDLGHETLKDLKVTSTGRRMRLLKNIAELRVHMTDETFEQPSMERLVGGFRNGGSTVANHEGGRGVVTTSTSTTTGMNPTMASIATDTDELVLTPTEEDDDISRTVEGLAIH